MKELLFLSFYFPPYAGIEVVRPAKWVKYLPLNGWRPIVLSTATEGEMEPLMAFDIGETAVYRTSEPILLAPAGQSMEHNGVRLPNWVKTLLQATMLFPDRYKNWIAAGRSMLPAIQRDHPQIQAIIATGYPWSSLVLGREAAQFFGVPLILDLRDAWTLNPSAIWNTLNHRRKEIELFTLADAVIFATESMKQEYEQIYPHLADQFYVIHNGFDPISIQRSALANANRNKLRITYTGTFDGHIIPPPDNAQSPYYFFLALQRLKQEMPDLSTWLEVCFAGKTTAVELVHTLGLEDLVQFRGHLSSEEALRLQGESDLLLLLVAPDNRHVVTGKVYEYMATTKPILALIPSETELESMLRQYVNAYVITPHDVSAMVVLLRQLLVRFRSGQRVNAGVTNQAFIDHFSRPKQVAALAALLEEVVEQSKR